MDTILKILQALALVASTMKTLYELWREYKHHTDDDGRRGSPGGNPGF